MEWNNTLYENAVLKRAVESLKMMEERKHKELPGELRKIAWAGVPYEFSFNQYRIKYLVKEGGKYVLHWYVVNGISGDSKTFYNVDYVRKNGNIGWRELASDMTKV